MLGVVFGVGAFGHLQLAKDDRAAGREPLDDGCILLRHVVLVDGHAGSSRHTLGPAQVFDRDRHAVQRAADFAAADLGFRGPRLRQCLLGHERRVAVQRAVERLDARKLSFGDLDGRQLARAQPAGEIGKLQIVKIGHVGTDPFSDTRDAAQGCSTAPENAPCQRRGEWKNGCARAVGEIATLSGYRATEGRGV